MQKSESAGTLQEGGRTSCLHWPVGMKAPPRKARLSKMSSKNLSVPDNEPVPNDLENDAANSPDPGTIWKKDEAQLCVWLSNTSEASISEDVRAYLLRGPPFKGSVPFYVCSCGSEPCEPPLSQRYECIFGEKCEFKALMKREERLSSTEWKQRKAECNRRCTERHARMHRNVKVDTDVREERKERVRAAGARWMPNV